MSDTPRTDAEAFIDASVACQAVCADFARQLERELAEARAERDMALKSLAIQKRAWEIATEHCTREEEESDFQRERAEKAEAECERLRNENSLMAAHQGIDNYQLVIGRAEKAEAECERLRDALQVCLSYWLSDANPDELQGSVAHMKHISGFAAAIDAARKP